MTIRDILIHPNETLLKPVDDMPVETINTEETHQIVRDLIETNNQDKGLGLAAPQIGIAKPIVIYTDDKGLIEVIVNPKIIARSGHTMSYAEGCLSVPKYRKDIRRARNITVIGYDVKGNQIKIKPFKKTTVINLQHEIDHLTGVTIVERTGKIVSQEND